MKLQNFTSLLLPLLLAICILYAVISIQRPLFFQEFSKSRELLNLFGEKAQIVIIPHQIEALRKDIQKLEQLLNLNSVSSRKGPSVVDGLYTFAKESQFSLLKVETGESLLIEKYHETSVTIKGKGSYESIGKLIERIENSPQSTRIRQLVLNNASGSEIETQIEFVIIGE